jgi:hypothetical protein
MSLTTDLLNSISQGISLARSGGPQVNPGEIIHFSLNIPDLANLSVPVIGQGDFSLTWLVKNVRFKDSLPAALQPDPNPPGDFLSLAESLSDYLVQTNILGGTPIADVQMPVPGPSLEGAIPPTSAIGIAISTVAGNVTPPVTNVTPTPVAASPQTLPNMPPLTPNAVNANDVLSGVPGLLGQVGGSIPMLMNLPVTVSVEWSVQSAIRLPTKKGFVPEFDFVDLVPGKDFLAPNGLIGTALDLIFAPKFKEYDGTQSSSIIYVSANVTLRAGDQTVTIAPPTDSLVSQLRLPVTVLDLGIPRVAAMFRHGGFAAQSGGDSGFVFVMVPGGYPFQAFDQLAPLLTQIQTTLGTLNSFVHIAGFLMGLDNLLAAVPAQPDIQFRAADKVDDLEDIVFQEGGITDAFFDYDADDEISSIIFLGIPGSEFDLFGDSGCQAGHHEIVLTTGIDMWAALSSFSFHGTPKSPPGDDKSQTDANQFLSPDSASVYVTGPAEDTWNDTTSSVCFGGNVGNQ